MNRIKKLVNMAIALGASEAEVYGSVGRNVTVETQHGDIGFAEESMSEGLGIRVIADGAIGYSSSNDPAKYEEAVRAAIACARSRGKDPNLKGLPHPRPYRNVYGIYDREVDEIKLDRCMDIAAGMVEEAKKDRAASVTFGKFSSIVSETMIVNSNGVEVEDKETMVYGYIDVIIKEGDNVSTAFEYDVSRALNLDFSTIGSKASGLARRSLNAEPVESHVTDVLLGPYAFADIIESTLLFSVNSESVQKGRSGLAEKIGQKIAAEGLTIIDDGLLESGLGSSRSDDEGTPSQETVIVNDGILESFLYDNYTAGKENRESTGNGIRNSYTMTPKVGPRNIRFEYPRCDVINETDKGIYVNSIIGAHTANPITGDFSVECRNAFTVEGGALGRPIKSMMISGNIFDLLSRVDGMSREEKVIGAIISPTVKIKGMRITPGA
ncbi:TldD/PmbA family protein [Methanocella sp. CWC-04]|uniref:TldD/PmbA family protein n=2 Tax=Methanooceanicella nereidis TaxID=2052831 RepID=A0AAP2W5U2_9EURY|nr:TldD/PmbA family protein [Methanocella sp. CWC-04]